MKVSSRFGKAHEVLHKQPSSEGKGSPPTSTSASSLTRDEEVLLGARLRECELELALLAVQTPDVLRQPDRAELCQDDAGSELPAPLDGRLRELTREVSDIRSRFVKANQGLVAVVVKRYLGQGLSLADLMQEGNLGLMRAIDRFDPERGCRFSTYAGWWIRQSAQRALANQARTIRIPVHVADARFSLKRSMRRIGLEHGRLPSAAELEADTGLSVSEAARLNELVSEPLSLETPRGAGDDARLADFVADPGARDPANDVFLNQRDRELERLMEALTPREQEMFRLRFGLGGTADHTLEEVGQRFGVTRERARQILKRGLAKLQRRARLSDIDPRALLHDDD
jgi:RNA polymerase primary sigma factor